METAGALQVHNQDSPPPEVSRDQLIKYLDAFGLTTELNDQEKNQFIEIAEAYQLNPFKREIYAVPFGEGEYRRLSIITGYEVYIKRAERTGKLDGWHAWVEGSSEEDFKAIVEIHRKDWSHPFVHEVYWKEAVQRKKDGSLTHFWTKMPRFQLRKVCISQAFRLAFPDELGGIPYDSSELPEEMTSPNPIREVSAETDINQANAERSQPEKTKPKNPVLERVSKRLQSNTDYFSENHLKWIESQMEDNPSEENLIKLESHIDDVIKNKSVIKPLKRMANKAKQRETAPAKKQEPALIF